MLGFLVILSAFFSSAETAYSSVSHIRLKNFVEEGRRGSKKALEIAEKFDNTISTILIGNNIVNILAASISATIAAQIFGQNIGLIVSTVFTTVIILTFGEILPKSLAKEYADRYALSISGIMYVLIKLLMPLNFIFSGLKRAVTKLFTHEENMPSLTEEELKIMLDLSEEEGVIDREERELIHRSMDFDDTITGEILTPRIDMIAIDINQSTEEIKHIFFQEHFSRIPVYDGSIDNIIGILSEKEFFTYLIKFGEVNVKELLREPLFVVESLKISSLLLQLQKEKIHMAIVIDEFGGTSGIITMEDVLEEIVGEIWDEQDEKVISVSQVNENVFKFDAQYPLDDFAEKMKVPQPDSSYHSLGGWVIENFEAIPTNGECFNYEHLTICAEEVSERRVRIVRVDVNESPEIELSLPDSI